jgi:hypothetical protein
MDIMAEHDRVGIFKAELDVLGFLGECSARHQQADDDRENSET